VKSVGVKEIIAVGLPEPAQPFSWAVRSGGMLFTTHGPVRGDGSIDTGGIEEQARLTFANLRRAVDAAGGRMEDVAQVLIYLTDAGDMQAVDRVYREFFTAPYPNRASIVAAALVVPGMKIEVVAYAMLAARPSP
jgi:enamine deaminase RidA (YjgF/YER057c/UK114 family)